MFSSASFSPRCICSCCPVKFVCSFRYDFWYKQLIASRKWQYNAQPGDGERTGFLWNLQKIRVWSEYHFVEFCKSLLVCTSLKMLAGCGLEINHCRLSLSLKFTATLLITKLYLQSSSITGHKCKLQSSSKCSKTDVKEWLFIRHQKHFFVDSSCGVLVYKKELVKT